MPAAVFDYTLWLARYPEFAATVPPALAAAYFEEAGGFFDNTERSPVADLAKRLRLLNMVTAHIAYLNAGTAGSPASPLVGRITNASEGSVSVAVDMGPVTAANAYWMQSKYGAAYWQATQSLRSFRYMPGRQPTFDRQRGSGGLIGDGYVWLP